MEMFTSNFKTLVLVGAVILTIFLIMKYVGKSNEKNTGRGTKGKFFDRSTQISRDSNAAPFIDNGTIISSDYEMQQLNEMNQVVKTYPLCNLRNGIVVGHYKGAKHTKRDENDIELEDNVRRSVSHRHAIVCEDDQGLFMQLLNEDNYITDSSHIHHSEIDIIPGEIYYIGKVPVRFVNVYDAERNNRFNAVESTGFTDTGTNINGSWKII